MPFITAHHGKLYTLGNAEGGFGSAVAKTLSQIARAGGPAIARKSFATGLRDLDRLAPGRAFRRGAVHELLCEADNEAPVFVASLIARGALGSGAIFVSDPQRRLFPPALAQIGLPLERVYLLHPGTPQEEVWAVTQCLLCKGVDVAIAALPRVSRVEARRLQLAAENGGGVALLMRQEGPAASIYAAATRWRVKPAPGERTVQRWSVELVHGHGGRLKHPLLLEHDRETRDIRTLEPSVTPGVVPATGTLGGGSLPKGRRAMA